LLRFFSGLYIIFCTFTICFLIWQRRYRYQTIGTRSGVAKPKIFLQEHKMPKKVQRVIGSQLRVNSITCSSCGQTFPAVDFKGRSKLCPSCGNPQEESDKGKYDPSGRIVTSTEEEQNAVKEEIFCPNCSHSRTGLKDSDPCPQCGAVLDSKPAPYQPASPVYQRIEPKIPVSILKYWPQVAIGAGVIVLVMFFSWLIVKLTTIHDEAAQITGFSWSRSVALEESYMDSGENWEDERPSGSTIISSEQKVRSYTTKEVGHTHSYRDITLEPKKIGESDPYVCGTEVVSNQYTKEILCVDDIFADHGEEATVESAETPIFSGKTPVPGTWVHWEMLRWRDSRSPSSGDNNRTAYWPEYSLRYNEREKLYGRFESYTVFFLRNKQSNKFITSQLEKWQMYPAEGSTCTAKVNGYDKVVDLVCP
jgi:hypothetical protein